MAVLETERLIVRPLSEKDADDYYDMMGNPNVMKLIPRSVMSRKESNHHLMGFVNADLNRSDTKAWAIETKLNHDFIGICAFLINAEGDHEIGYRLREKFWRNGFGTEIAKGLISFGFNHLNMDKITADVAVNNLNSVRILEKFMTSKKVFFNASDNCYDRRYEVFRKDWLH